MSHTQRGRRGSGAPGLGVGAGVKDTGHRGSSCARGEAPQQDRGVAAQVSEFVLERVNFTASYLYNAVLKVPPALSWLRGRR